MPLSQLEQRLEEIDTELKGLAGYSLRSGVGAVGYESKTHKTPHNSEWIHIDLDKEYSIDQIILVPSIWRDPKAGLRADGFPLTFRILAGTAQTSLEIASYTPADNLLPRIAPLIVSCPPQTTASWVRIEASELSPQGWDGKYALHFSEIMIFSGNENIAVNQPVSVPNPDIRSSEGRRPRFLVDGFVPYLMDSAQGVGSKAYILRSGKRIGRRAITIDLGGSFPVSQINLHSVDLSHNIPEAAPNGYAMPRRLRVTGANHADFSNETALFEFQLDSIYDAGPIIIRRFPETACRYVRLIVEELQANTSFQRGQSSLGFAEIEVLSNGRNIAQGKPADSNHFPEHGLQAMFDGNNFFGTILPIKEWMTQLARRHDLETERPLIETELNRRYARQKINLQIASWLIALLLAGAAFALLILRMLQMRTVSRIRERFAADLHDELGADIHTIGLLGDVALRSKDSPEKLDEILQRSRDLTERTGTAVRHCIDFQEAGGLFGSLPDDMRRTANRFLSNLESDITIKGEEILERLKPQCRTDLFLFFKESLVNISRHTEATRFRAELTAGPKQIELIISDNGQGRLEEIPPSLKRRAHLLGAKVTTAQSHTGETQVILKLRLHGKLRRKTKPRNRTDEK